MNKAEKTRQFIIEKTAPLFNTKGYAVTSLSDITDATGLTKGSIYGNFANKDQVVIEAFLHNVNQLKKDMVIAIEKADNNYDKLNNLVEFYRNYWKKVIVGGGCPMLNASTEADDHLLFLKESVQESFVGWKNKISEILEQGKLTKEFKENIASEDYAYTIIMLIEGGILLSRTLGNKQHLNQALDRIIIIINEEIKI